MFGFCEMSDSIKKRNNLNIIRFPVVTFIHFIQREVFLDIAADGG